jgi:hypothetical protein
MGKDRVVRKKAFRANFLELRHDEVRRTPLLGTLVNKGKSKGWAMGKPTSNSGKEKELLREGRPTPPIP